MSNVRIYELAKKIGVTSKVVLSELAKLGIKGKTHSSGIEPDIAKKLENALAKKKPEPAT